MKGFQRCHELLNVLRFPVLLYTYKCSGKQEQDTGSSCTVERKPTPVIPTGVGEQRITLLGACFGMCVPTRAKSCGSVVQRGGYCVRINKRK